MREAAHSANSSRGGELQQSRTEVGGRTKVETDPATDGTARKAPIARQTEKIEKPQSGKENRPSPREAKSKRAPRGTFDRTAYQREYMRKQRAEEKAK